MDQRAQDIAGAKEKGDRFRGRKPSYDRETFDLAVYLLSLGDGPGAVSKKTDLSRQTLIRICVSGRLASGRQLLLRPPIYLDYGISNVSVSDTAPVSST